MYNNTQHPQSPPSSTALAVGPEGIEREAPDLHVTNPDLPIAPAPGHNEAQYIHAASFKSDMSYQMRRYLAHQEPHIVPIPDPYATERTTDHNDNYLSQGVHVQGPKKVKKATGKATCTSWGSIEEALLDGDNPRTWGYGEMGKCIGAWAEYPEAGYGDTLIMSSLSEEERGQ